MRVVLVLGRSTGGIGTHVGALAEQLRRLGHDVLVVTDASTAAHFGWADARCWWPTDASGLRRWGPRLRRAAQDADVVHAHGLQAGLAVGGALVGRRRRPRTVLSLHNPPPGGTHGPVARAARLLATVAVRRADLVTGASADLVALATTLGARAARLAPVPSPLVPALLAAEPPSEAQRGSSLARLGLDAEGRKPLLLTVSRIAPQKRLDLVVDAAALMRHDSDTVWAVAGGGDPELIRLLASGAEDTGVRFLGPRSDVGDLLRAASVLVVTSDWEARALVVQEAMAAAVPVVATAVGGTPELLAGTGVLVPPGSPAALAAALDDLLDQRAADPSALAERGARERAVAETWDDGAASARRWSRWYADLIAMS